MKTLSQIIERTFALFISIFLYPVNKKNKNNLVNKKKNTNTYWCMMKSFFKILLIPSLLNDIDVYLIPF